MRNPSPTDVDVAIVGAGPFGLSAATYLKDEGVGVAIFGDPMSFWRDHMPAGMYLRSNWPASHISDPHGKLTLDHYKADAGVAFKQPVPLQNFVEYGQWYQQKALPELCKCQVSGVEAKQSGFQVTLADGSVVKSKRVIIATGIAPFPWMPKAFEGLPKSHVTHSSDHCDLSRFHDQQLAVVGSGQSALDAARLLYAFDAKPEVIARQTQIRWVGEHQWLHRLGFLSWCLYSQFDVGPAGISRLVGFPNIFRLLPRSLQDPISYRAIRPAGTGWQRPYLANVPMTLNAEVASTGIQGDKIRLKLSDGTERVVDHVIAATGYKVAIARYSFLSAAIRNSLKTVGGNPVLARGFESSVPGLHFVGKPAAWSFGPLLNFVSGTHFAGAEILRAL
jgi:FAD-dependent urate hydroxylase